ncbi:MAG: hypothetical protein VX835_03025 [Pseudomonadota bacterium]|nr:hypothetical protein [Pseudomonadota bacterium]
MKALIIGINSHLGRQTALNLSRKGFSIYGTTRNKPLFKSSTKNFIYDTLDLIHSKEHDFQSIFEQGPFDVVLHYASPHDVNTRLDNVSEQLRKDFYQCMSHDQLMLELAYNNLNKNGSLIISGAIIADDIFIGQSGMSGIHKANLKRIAAEYHNLSIHQNKPIHIKYLNLGSFKDEITQIEDGMPTDEVVTKILNIIDHPTQFSHKIDIMAPFEAKKYGYDI